MTRIFHISQAEIYEAKLRSSDIVTIEMGLNHFCNEANAVVAISRLPLIATFLDHATVEGIRTRAMIVFHHIGMRDPTYIRPYVPAIAARLGAEPSHAIRNMALDILEAVAKEDDPTLLGEGIEHVVAELKTHRGQKAARILRAVHTKAPGVIQSMSEASRELVTKKGIGAPRKRIAREAKPKGFVL